MNKHILTTKNALVILSVLLTFSSYGQNNTGKACFLRLKIGLGEDDTRLYEFPQKNYILSMQSGFIGTYRFEAEIYKKWVIGKKMVFNGGLGLGYELSTFFRPFDSNYPNDTGFQVLTFTDRYSKLIFQIPLSGDYFISKNIYFNLEIKPQVSFYTSAENSVLNGEEKYTLFKFDFNSIEINPGIHFNNSNIIYGINYRVFQFKKIDKIIFNDIIGDPRVDKKYETVNPFMLFLSVALRI